jgi:mRNA interferase HigB
VRVISIKKLKDFWLIHNDSEQQLKAWYREAEKMYMENARRYKEKVSQSKYCSR